MRRQPTRDTPIPVCDLQIRSYNVRNLEIVADFALRAAYYLELPAYGPVPLPKIVERWTVPRSNFAHSKTPENFERVTRRRLIQIKDGDLGVVDEWLRFLCRYRYFGVGMKANVFEYAGLEVMEEHVHEADAIRDEGSFGEGLSRDVVDGLRVADPFKARWGAAGPQGAAVGVPPEVLHRSERGRI